MLDFETPTYITAKESQQMQSGVSPTLHNSDTIKPKNASSIRNLSSLLEHCPKVVGGTAL